MIWLSFEFKFSKFLFFSRSRVSSRKIETKSSMRRTEGVVAIQDFPHMNHPRGVGDRIERWWQHRGRECVTRVDVFFFVFYFFLLLIARRTLGLLMYSLTNVSKLSFTVFFCFFDNFFSCLRTRGEWDGMIRVVREK